MVLVPSFSKLSLGKLHLTYPRATHSFAGNSRGGNAPAPIETDDLPDEALEIGDVPDFPRFMYSREEIADAGDTIACELPWTGRLDPKIERAFHIANS